MSSRNDAILVHFYRAVVAHMDVWRRRMDATTNWAAATAAAMITFSFGNSAAPHYVLLLAFVFQVIFLLMESRRYQVFDLWRRRFRVLNRGLIVPALEGREAAPGAGEMAALAADMGRTVPHLGLVDALGYRTRRNYGYLFGVTLLAWLLKLEVQPEPARSAAVLVGRASVAFVPGWVVVAVVLGAFALCLAIGFRAPTGDMLAWEDMEPTWARWRARIPGLPRRGGGGD
jgi:uncharacterized membrane protein